MQDQCDTTSTGHHTNKSAQKQLQQFHDQISREIDYTYRTTNTEKSIFYINISKEIDPCHLSDVENKFLIRLFDLDRKKNGHESGYAQGSNTIHISFDGVNIFQITFMLRYSLIHRLSRSETKVHNDYYYEVLSPSRLSQSNNMIPVIGTLSPTVSNNFKFVDKNRIAQELETADAFLNRRGYLLLKTPHLCVKNLTFFQDHYYAIMRQQPGKDLCAHLNESKFSADELLVICRMTAIALRAQIHQNGIIHRDLKPEHIMVGRTSNGFVVNIIGLSHSKVMHEDDTGELVGTPGYIAPELTSYNKDVLTKELPNNSTKEDWLDLLKNYYIEKSTTATDVFSLGITFAEMFNAEIPSLLEIHQIDEIRHYSRNPKFNYLFSRIDNFNDDIDRLSLTTLITEMTKENPTERCDLHDIINKLDSLILARKLRDVDIHLNGAHIKTAYEAGRISRNLVHDFLSKKQISVLSLNNIFLIIKKQISNLHDAPEAIEIFVSSFCSPALSSIKKKETLLLKISSIIIATSLTLNEIQELKKHLKQEANTNKNPLISKLLNHFNIKADCYLKRYSTCFDDLMTLANKNKRLCEKITAIKKQIFLNNRVSSSFSS